ncbi:MAG: hypothetical protein OXC18_14775 [Desulfurellaceae bacterium]|nr:hypothetical protein [Desulfurellaceae bacterium]
MQPGTWLTPTALILASGLLVLAGVFSDARPASAQAQEACPLPAGVTPSAPSVTAQQVEDGSASLMAFVLAAKAQLSSQSLGLGTVGQQVYETCEIRRAGSPWRAGSTYLVQLTFAGRIFAHAKDMALSDRLLDPVIYEAILRASGISPADLVNPGTDQATGGDGGPFNIPDIPGASGYASAYYSENFGAWFLLLAGFDLNATHLVEEALDYGDPAMTARGVVDLSTLKVFVKEAEAFFLSAFQTFQFEKISRAKLALRDPNGPWRHGAVYLHAVNTSSNLTLFHAAFPDRFEGRPPGITRDLRTGELVIDQMVAAANSSPEGGFWTYSFDNPVDDTDRAVPKVGYARVIGGEILQWQGIVVASGFYPDVEDMVGVLENPGPHSFQSGVSALWGWVCDAAIVEIEIETAQGEVEQYRAAYGMERLDTRETCGDADNGFEMVFNWNLLGDGEHTVTALVNGVELGRATVQVTTVGEGDQQEFLQGVEGECVAEDFPHLGQRTRLEWQQNSQNFVITEVQ